MGIMGSAFYEDLGKNEKVIVSNCTIGSLSNKEMLAELCSKFDREQLNDFARLSLFEWYINYLLEKYSKNQDKFYLDEANRLDVLLVEWKGKFYKIDMIRVVNGQDPVYDEDDDC